MPYAGEIAALTTAALWAITSVFFSEAGKRIGSFNVNAIRLVMAVIIYATVMTITTGSPIPSDINSKQLFWLGLSGFVGLVFGDSCGFKALVMIGPRLMTLLYSTAPIFASIIAWIFLGESLRLIDVLGISITISGVLWVITERKANHRAQNSNDKNHPDSGSFRKGIWLGLGAGLGQGLGLVLAKQGMMYSGNSIAAMPASFIRMLVATVCIWLIAAMTGKIGGVVSKVRDLNGMKLTLGGAFFGPFLGVWMSLVALEYIRTGVAATLNATTPIMIIPVVMFYYKEKVSWRAFIGAIIAVGGVTILFLT
ncbi:MAG TPA: DMT family transporter [candidate division Zixibacteria bacterium]|nr:DMT family transporter [candidate division Zixibacteria bacterium]